MAKTSYRTRDLTECALMAALSALLALLGLVPPLSLVLPMFSPVPVTWVGARSGPALGWMAALIATAICFMLSSPTGAYLYLMPFGALGAIFGAECFRSDDGDRVLSSASWKVAIILVIALMGIERLLGLPDGIVELRFLIATGLWILFGLFPGGAALAGSLTDAAITLPVGMLYPMAWVFCFANQIFCFLLFSRLGQPVVPPVALPRGPAPHWMTRPLLLLTASLPFLPGSGLPLPAQGLVVNLWLIGLFRCYVHGFLRVATWLRRRAMPAALRIVISLTWPVLGIPVVIVIGGTNLLSLDDGGEKFPELAGFRPGRRDA